MRNPPAALAECAALFRPTLAMSARPVPAPPGAERLSHDETLVLFAKPRQLLGEHRHALAPGTGHLRDVGAPEHAVRTKGIEDLPQINLHRWKRIGDRKSTR